MPFNNCIVNIPPGVAAVCFFNYLEKYHYKLSGDMSL